MRRGKDYRLNIALSQMVERPLKWTPSQEALAEYPRGKGGLHYRPLTLPYDVSLDDVYKTWLSVVQEQGTAPTSWPKETMMHRRARRAVMDHIIARMSDEDAHAAFEKAALRGDDAEVDLLPDSESVGLPVPIYSTRWRRASDETFAMYAPLAQRRPA